MQEARDWDEAWEAFDAALRRAERPEPPPGLRERCLPPGAVRFRRRDLPFRILVVDDQPNIRRLIQVHLEKAGYAVDLACDGLEGLERVDTERPDLIVLDMMMPHLDGLQVLERLKSDPRTGEIPVVVLSARGSDAQIREGLLQGADLYLSKPFDPAALREIIDRTTALLGTPENPPPVRVWLK